MRDTSGPRLRGDDVDLNHLCVPCAASNRCAARPSCLFSNAPHRLFLASPAASLKPHASHMSDAELAKYKALMEEDFRKNRLLPGDPGYEYDKQVRAAARP
jgi:hypothetical protein